jgi:hypothetical protein
MTQQICKNCKYWELTNSYPIKDTKIGKCKKAKMFWNSTEWTDEKNDDWIAIRTLKKENKTDRAFVQDGSDYMASLLTLEEFGCNQFSE